MAHLWRKDGAGQWGVESLASGSTRVFDSEVALFGLESVGSAGPAERWALIFPIPCRAVYVNGGAVRSGIRVLRDRDAVQVSGGQLVFFSTERLARVEPLPAGLPPTHCPRCKQQIEPDTDAVRCPSPGCRAWHHQSDELGCWRYADTCALCPQPTDVEAGYQWTPQGLGA